MTLHDVQVKDGLLYAAWWRDGLIILDVGNGLKGGSPEKPVFVSQLRFNYHELYGDGWLAGAHAVFRYRELCLPGRRGLPGGVRSGPAVIALPFRASCTSSTFQTSPIRASVATYDVPEGGAHNIWVEDDVVSMGYYNAGARVVDVSGELRGGSVSTGPSELPDCGPVTEGMCARICRSAGAPSHTMDWSISTT